MKKILIIIAAAVLALGVGLGIGVYMNNHPKDSKSTITEVDGGNEKWQEGVIEYNGKQYKYNNRIKSYLFMGVDRSGEVEELPGGGTSGQTDAMFLLIQDKLNKKLSILAIHRNTMADVDVYDINRNKVDTKEMQICLQHSYGDGMKLSCNYAVDAVSRLLNNIPISGYYSMRMDGIPVLNDAVGGIEVEVLEDVTDSGKNVNLKKGEVKTLSGKEAYVYIRKRDVDTFDSATGRLNRQKQYIEVLIEKVRKIANGSKSDAMKIYDQIEDYSVTNMALGDLVYELKDYEYSGKLYELPGETVMGPDFEEYVVDPEELYQLVIDLFYEEV